MSENRLSGGYEIGPELQQQFIDKLHSLEESMTVVSSGYMEPDLEDGAPGVSFAVETAKFETDEGYIAIMIGSSLYDGTNEPDMMYSVSVADVLISDEGYESTVVKSYEINTDENGQKLEYSEEYYSTNPQIGTGYFGKVSSVAKKAYFDAIEANASLSEQHKLLLAIRDEIKAARETALSIGEPPRVFTNSRFLEVMDALSKIEIEE